MGLLAISAPLVKAGYQVKIIDQRVEADWKETILKELKNDPICFGVTIMAGGQALKFGIEASRTVKQNSSIPVVWGGIYTSYYPEQIVSNPNIDIVVSGEGEDTFLELVNAIRGKVGVAEIKGIYYKKNEIINYTGMRPYLDLNKCLPYPYHLVNMKKYILQRPNYKVIDFISSRGCPFHCAFCYHSFYDPGHWSALSAEETLNRIWQLKRDYGINGIRFKDDNFFADENRAIAILEGFIKEGFNAPYHGIDLRMDTLYKFNGELFKLFEDSGVSNLRIGIESGSKKILELMDKQIDVSQVISTNKKMSRFKIYPFYTFVIGAPSESNEELADTVNLFLRLIEDNKRASGLFCIFVPFFGTKLYGLSLEYGLKVPKTLEEWSLYAYNFSEPGNNKPWIGKARRKFLMNLRFCSVVILSARRQIYFYKSPLLVYIYQLAAKICFPFAKKRMRNFNFSLFIEKYMADLIIGKY
jgi:radical SAM superfamily enzyme YgiQ (UPF0313 family)